MRKVDDAQQPKNHRQAQAEHGVKRAVHQAQQQLAQEGLDGDAEYLHGLCAVNLSVYEITSKSGTSIRLWSSTPFRP